MDPLLFHRRTEKNPPKINWKDQPYHKSTYIRQELYVTVYFKDGQTNPILYALKISFSIREKIRLVNHCPPIILSSSLLPVYQKQIGSQLHLNQLLFPFCSWCEYALLKTGLIRSAGSRFRKLRFRLLHKGWFGQQVICGQSHDSRSIMHPF